MHTMPICRWPRGSITEGRQHCRGEAGHGQRHRGADTVLTQGPRAGQQLGGGFPSSCPSPRLASHPEHGCKRLSCDRQLPVRSRLGAGAAGRDVLGAAGPCPRHRPRAMLRRKPSNAGDKEPGHRKVSAGGIQLPSASQVSRHIQSCPSLRCRGMLSRRAGARGLGQRGSDPAIGPSLLPPLWHCGAAVASPVHGLGLVHLPVWLPSCWDGRLGCTAPGISVGASWGAGGTHGAVLGEAVPPHPPWPRQAWAAPRHFLGATAVKGAAVGLQLRHVRQPLPPAAPLRDGSRRSPSCRCHGPSRAPCVARPCATLWLKSPVGAKTGSSSPARSRTSWHFGSCQALLGWHQHQ